jgi:MATE family multidrug resistance protein
MSRDSAYRTEVRTLLLLAGPVVLTQLAQVSLGFVDTVMVGRLGAAQLAGVALGNTVFFTLILMCMGMVLAVGPMVSQAHGAGADEPIGRSVRQGQWLALMLAAGFTLVVWNVRPVLVALGQEASTVDLAVSYLRAIVWGAFPFLGFVGLRSFVEGVSRPRPVTVIAFLGIGMNVFANWTLMYGKFGFPALGIVGTGWASAIVFWLDFLLLLAYVASQSEFRRFRIFEKLGRPDRTYFRELFRIGWPIGASFGIESSMFMITVMMMGWIGTTALAAHQVALQCASFTFMVPLGIGIATSVRVGQEVGRGDREGVLRAGRVGLGLSVLFMSLAALAFWLVPRAIVGIYLDLDAPANAPVVALAVALLQVAAVFQVADGIQVTAAGALRGLKDTRVPMAISALSYWAVGLTGAWFLAFRLGWGATGLWWGLVLGLAAAAAMLLARFRSMAASGTAVAPAFD